MRKLPGETPQPVFEGRSPRLPRKPEPRLAAPLVWSLLGQHLLWGAHGRVPSLSLGCVFPIGLSLWTVRALPCRPPLPPEGQWTRSWVSEETNLPGIWA